MDDLDVGRLERRHVSLRAAPGGFNDLDPALDNGGDVFGIGRVGECPQERQVHREGVVGHAAAARDLTCQELGRLLCQPGNDAETACLRNCRGKLRKPDIMHATLDDGVADAKHFGDGGFQTNLRTRLRPTRWIASEWPAASMLPATHMATTPYLRRRRWLSIKRSPASRAVFPKAKAGRGGGAGGLLLRNAASRDRPVRAAIFVGPQRPVQPFLHRVNSKGSLPMLHAPQPVTISRRRDGFPARKPRRYAAGGRAASKPRRPQRVA